MCRYAAIKDNMVQLQPKKGKGDNTGNKRAGKVDGKENEEAAQTLWCMTCEDDAGSLSL